MWKQAHLEFESWLIFRLENEIVENFEIVANVEDYDRKWFIHSSYKS